MYFLYFQILLKLGSYHTSFLISNVLNHFGHVRHSDADRKRINTLQDIWWDDNFIKSEG